VLWQPSLPERYLRLSPDELAEAIAARRKELGDKLFILGHHYQTDEVVRHADVTGDSLKLSQIAAKVAAERPVKWVVFCGVHFMAESADMLTPEHVEVILPDLSAGCSMADMAQYDDTVQAWDDLHDTLAEQGWKGRIIPITYVNSSAAIKAFVGARGGACCTSSNAKRVFEWAVAEAGEDGKILFLPDQHLGRNTAKAKGFVTEVDAARKRGAVAQTALWNPRKKYGGNDRATVRDADILLWQGHCSVHKLFRPEHIEAARQDGRTVLVHPECAQEVVDLADLRGSTEMILETLRSATPGSRWAVGTEVHLVNRIARESAGRGVDVRILSDCQCLCTTMYRIDQAHLLWTLDHLAAGEVVNEVRVHPDARRLALLALERMLKNVARRPEPIAVD
jgi:quinolinate synthase